jgi:YegS/Rv2252/BmrU family lipid kinase
MLRTKVIFNPKAHGGEAAGHLEQIKALLKAAGVNFELSLTDKEGDARRQAKEAVERGFQTVVACGGDGVAGEVAGALVGTKAVFGMIPLGSGDDFAKSLKTGRNLPDAVEAIKQRKTKKVDAGVVNGWHYFNSLGLGLDGEVIVEKQKIKGLRDLKLYVLATVRALMRYKGQRFSLDFGQGKVWVEALLVEIMNGRSVGGGYLLTPEAEIDDGWLDICIIHKLTWLEFFRHVPKSFKGKHTHLKQIVMGRTQKVVVESEQPIAAQVDGELWPKREKRYEVSIIPNAVECIIGNHDWT